MTQADDLRARVLAAAATTTAPTRPEGRRRAIALASISIVFALGWFQAAGGLEHSAGRPLATTIAIATGWATWCGALSWLVLRRKTTLGRPPAVVLAAALATPVVLLAWMHVFDGTYAEPFARFGWRCMGHTLAMAALPLVSFLALRRGVEPRGPGALGAAVGAVCGAWAGVLVDMWCPLANTPHVVVGHVAPLLVLVAAGGVAGARVLGVRR